MYERMLNKQERPSLDDLTTHCGRNAELFGRLNRFLSDDCGTTQEIRFPYGKSYGWCVTHRKGKRLICDVFAERDAFTVMLRLTEKQFDDVYGSVSAYSREYIDAKYPCSNGGWIHYRVLCDAHFEDIAKMLSAKTR